MANLSLAVSISPRKVLIVLLGRASQMATSRLWNLSTILTIVSIMATSLEPVSCKTLPMKCFLMRPCMILLASGLRITPTVGIWYSAIRLYGWMSQETSNKGSSSMRWCCCCCCCYCPSAGFCMDSASLIRAMDDSRLVTLSSTLAIQLRMSCIRTYQSGGGGRWAYCGYTD